jgi:hypothetical protein
MTFGLGGGDVFAGAAKRVVAVAAARRTARRGWQKVLFIIESRPEGVREWLSAVDEQFSTGEVGSCIQEIDCILILPYPARN